jgi:tRNA1Val (adenine37-N6)-methyltransferase
MKVCTDACLFGGWVTHEIEKSTVKIENALDIGAGTGLLSLMLAQKMNVPIDAVEVDKQAALQAKENFRASPWHDRLNIHHSSIQQFVPQNKYDYIISNPPFFQNSLRSENETRNMAKHATALSFTTLVDVVYNLLKPSGKFGVLLPYQEFKGFEEIAGSKNLNLVQLANIQQAPSHSYFRSMAIFVKESIREITRQTIVIKDEENQYTSEFTKLLKDYYLYL